MNWILLSILAAGLYTVIYVIDKLMIDNLIKKPSLAAAVSSLSTFAFFIATSIIKTDITFDNPKIIVLSLLAGVVNGLTILLYYYILSKEEMSRFIPVLSLMPAFVIILSYFILNETFSTIIYVGIFLVIIGSILISLKKSDLKIKLNLSFLLAILTAMGFAVKNVLIKLGSQSIDVHEVNYWLGIGAGLMFFIFLTKGWDKNKKIIKASTILFFVDLISAGTFYVLAIALSHGPASLVSSMIQLKLVFTFIVAIIFSVFFPKILKEKLSKFIIIQKTFAIIIIIFGALLIIN
ncbi:MAG: DMT family transporter [Patescibacteria group bacterium]